MRLISIAIITTAAVTVQTHQSQPYSGAVQASSAREAITPAPASTSMASAPARAGHDANRARSAPVPSSATGPGLSSTAVTTT